MKRCAYIPLLLLVVTTGARSQPIPVSTLLDGDDSHSVASRMGYFLSEEIRSSNTFLPCDDETNPMVCVLIHVIALEENEYAISYSASYSYTWVTRNNGVKEYASHLIGHTVGRCGLDRARSCATGIVATLNNYISQDGGFLDLEMRLRLSHLHLYAD